MLAHKVPYLETADDNHYPTDTLTRYHRSENSQTLYSCITEQTILETPAIRKNIVYLCSRLTFARAKTAAFVLQGRTDRLDQFQYACSDSIHHSPALAQPRIMHTYASCLEFRLLCL
jgi:hypothetical protein